MGTSRGPTVPWPWSPASRSDRHRGRRAARGSGWAIDLEGTSAHRRRAPRRRRTEAPWASPPLTVARRRGRLPTHRAWDGRRRAVPDPPRGVVDGSAARGTRHHRGPAGLGARGGSRLGGDRLPPDHRAGVRRLGRPGTTSRHAGAPSRWRGTSCGPSATRSSIASASMAAPRSRPSGAWTPAPTGARHWTSALVDCSRIASEVEPDGRIRPWSWSGSTSSRAGRVLISDPSPTRRRCDPISRAWGTA